MAPSPALVKKPGAGASCDALEVAAERKLLFEVLKERRVTVLERVARMERNLRAVEQLRRTQGVTEDHVDLYFNQAVAMSDLMTAATWGARPSDPPALVTAPEELAPAKIDPSWLESVRENARQEAEAAGAPGSIEEAQAQIRAAMALERGNMSASWAKTSSSMSMSTAATAASDETADPQSRRPSSKTPPGKGKKLDAKSIDACEDLSELAAGRPPRSRRKPMLQSVATRLKKTIVRRPKQSEAHLEDSLDATLVRTTETRKSADGARIVRVRKIKKRVKKVKPMKQDKHDKSRRRSVMGIRKSFVVSMTDAFSSSQPAKSKDASFEMKMDDLKAKRRRSLGRSRQRQNAAAPLSTQAQPEDRGSATNVSDEHAGLGPGGSTAQDASTGPGARGPRMLSPAAPPNMEPGIAGVRVGMLTSQSKRYLANRSSLDFSGYAMYFGGAGLRAGPPQPDVSAFEAGASRPEGAFTSSGAQDFSQSAAPDGTKRSRPKSYDARGLQTQLRRPDEYYELEQSRSSFCMRIKRKSSATAQLFASFKKKSFGASSASSSQPRLPEDAEEVEVDAYGSFRSSACASEYSEFTILEEEEEEDEELDSDQDDEDMLARAEEEIVPQQAREFTGSDANEDFYVQLTF